MHTQWQVTTKIYWNSWKKSKIVTCFYYMRIPADIASAGIFAVIYKNN